MPAHPVASASAAKGPANTASLRRARVRTAGLRGVRVRTAGLRGVRDSILGTPPYLTKVGIESHYYFVHEPIRYAEWFLSRLQRGASMCTRCSPTRVSSAAGRGSG